MTDFVDRAVQERRLGLALHYRFLQAAVFGLAARRTFEFGAGGSTRVFAEALPPDGVHVSVSGESRDAVSAASGVAAGWPGWVHHHGLSEAHRDLVTDDLDLVLHDGSHAADVVAADVEWVWPRVKRFGLLLVHDTQHSYVGAGVREGLRRGLDAAGARFTATTLPWGFGLTVVRRESGGPASVAPAVAKSSSPHSTELSEFWLSREDCLQGGMLRRRVAPLAPTLLNVRRLVDGRTDGPVELPDDVVRALDLRGSGGTMLWRERGSPHAQGNGLSCLGGGFMVRWEDLAEALGQCEVARDGARGEKG